MAGVEMGKVGIAGREGWRDQGRSRDSEDHRGDNALPFFHDALRVVESVSSEDALNSREIRPLNYRPKIQNSLMFLATSSTLRKAFAMDRFAAVEGAGRALAATGAMTILVGRAS
ncbi:hypothetical protein BOS5A_220032 [Bosea sp. EC-HK365B]|nr:hypothetical protein BOSE7B_40155 [Bosea sp. 7B]CAD5290448.1 hypothetical protein BOSE21B_60031 [Bosea sp. 21B]VVT60687.1 hypothetical protein BOS5A_220032 [Bosea sp. EC-HK365B]VXB53679.1 hypothetical protein BOSE127_130031 [Bosea sp. 127]